MASHNRRHHHKHQCYAYEKHRLATYAGWPVDAPVQARYLAREGFCATGRKLEVLCMWCGAHIKRWMPGEDVHRRHQHCSPDCAMIVAPNQCGNVAMEPVYAAGLAEPMTYPHCPKYASMEARLGSFSSWPIGHIQAAEAMAEAGFYYQQADDWVQCHHCNLLIGTWRQEEQPWTLHAVFSPNCQFLLNTKGSSFVHQMLLTTLPGARMEVPISALNDRAAAAANPHDDQQIEQITHSMRNTHLN